jgi:hypothetical protein
VGVSVGVGVDVFVGVDVAVGVAVLVGVGVGSSPPTILQPVVNQMPASSATSNSSLR